MNLKNDLLLRAAQGQKVERVPVWVMRQAGRILKEYREVRSKAGSFINLAKNPEMASEVTIQPVDILGVDAAIIFSDILVVPEAMDLPYEMVEKVGPRFPKVVRTKEDISLLNVNDIEDRLSYVLEAIKLTKIGLDNRVPLIGFAGAPFTIFCYMIEGKGSKTFSEAKKMLYTQPELSHLLLQKITDVTIIYLKGQIKAGVNLVQLFDSWAGILSPNQYETFAIPYISQICQSISEVPVTVFAKGAFFARERIGQLSCEVVGLDWNMNITESRNLIPNKTLQGNLDPCILYGTTSEIEKATKAMLSEFGRERYIANLGHGIYPDMHPDKLKSFINTVQAW
jgi:uroporphyrinogen decarboxylase